MTLLKREYRIRVSVFEGARMVLQSNIVKHISDANKDTEFLKLAEKYGTGYGLEYLAGCKEQRVYCIGNQIVIFKIQEVTYYAC